MKPKDFLKKHGINADAELVVNIIMLLIPGIRVVGAIWMYTRIQRKYGFMGMKKFLLFMLMLFIATGTMAEILTNVIWPLSLAGLVAAIGYFFFSRDRDRRGEVQAFLTGRDNCDIDQLAGALDMSEKQVIRCVNSLKKQGKLPDTTYIDKANRLIVLTPEGRPEYSGSGKNKKARVDRRSENKQTAEPQVEPEAPSNEMSKYDKILYQIRYINEQIDDRAMTEKIYHIENTTANIFHLVEQKPERANEIQSFMEYYLPTTMNLLYRYSQLEKQGDVGGENMATAKRNIENIMDKVVEGFDTQLDKLFKSDAIDITNDVKVLEKMMQMDRLTK